jgi:hypothetical protein
VAWCKASSLTAATSEALRGLPFPATRPRILKELEGKTAEGWDLPYLVGQALAKKRYSSLRSVMTDLEGWLERQG